KMVQTLEASNAGLEDLPGGGVETDSRIQAPGPSELRGFETDPNVRVDDLARDEDDGAYDEKTQIMRQSDVEPSVGELPNEASDAGETEWPAKE
ncbi:MAG: hypothetical protein AAFY60_15340, partial [Myxococcota bacterium]